MSFSDTIYLLHLPIGTILDFDKRATIGQYSAMSLVPVIGINPITRCISVRCPLNDNLIIKRTILIWAGDSDVQKSIAGVVP